MDFKVKRTLYLINPRFQLKTGLFISSLVFILGLFYPLIIFELLQQQVALWKPQGGQEIFEQYKWTLWLILFLMQFGLFIFVFAICIFQGHKIAGPLYKLKKILGGIAKGEEIPVVKFRKNDHFLDLADTFNQAFSTIKNNHNKDFAYIGEVIAFIRNLSTVIPEDKKAVLAAINQRLEEIQNRFRPL